MSATLHQSLTAKHRFHLSLTAARRSASAEDQLYGTWDPLTHFADNGPVPDYVAMVQRFARHIQTEGLLDAEETA